MAATESRLKEDARALPAARLIRWYLGHFRDDALRITAATSLALVQSAALVPVPLLFRHIIDVNLPQKDIRGLAYSGATALGLYTLHACMAFSSRTLALKATKKVTESLRARLCIQLQQLSLRFYDLEKASELSSRVVLDTERIDVMGNAATVEFTSAFIMLLVAMGLLFWLNPTLMVLCLIFLPIYYLSHKKLRVRLQEVHRSFREEMELMNSQVSDLLSAIRLVKTFAREDHEQQRAENQFRSVTRSALNMTIFTAFYTNLMGWISNMAILFVYVGGGYLIIRDTMTVGDLVAFAAMLGFMINPVNQILNMAQMIYSGVASLGPVYTLLHINDPLETAEGKTTIEDLSGQIEFEDVSLVYEATDKHALLDTTVSIRKGETIALVGESGAGKSTFANLVLGFYTPTKGTVRIDGRDIREVDLRSLRERIGVVSQDNVLINTSIRENLKYGKLDASDEEIYEAARLANAHEFITQIPGGYDAVVGDRGTRLSGGQRQRLAIARAILKDPSILILDEATSALDSESEAKIQEALARLQANRTSLVIAHRLSTIISADRILVLKAGRIVEMGTHGELLEKGGEYAHLCERQFGKSKIPSAS